MAVDISIFISMASLVNQVIQPGNLGWREAFEKLLDELRVAEELFIAGVVVVLRGAFHACVLLNAETPAEAGVSAELTSNLGRN